MIGVRRLIAQRMTEAKRNIPHFSYVEEVDVTELESLRAHLNRSRRKGAPALTYLPFIVAALARVLDEVPAVQRASTTPSAACCCVTAPCTSASRRRRRDGLKVPVVRHAEARSLCGSRRRDPPRLRGGAQRQGDARGAHGLDDHGHEPRQAGRHRVDADHQRARGGASSASTRPIERPVVHATARSPSGG